jgi:hypothetical protein
VISRLPFFKILAVAQIALLVRRHLRNLTAMELRRMGELVRRGHKLNRDERSELRSLVAKLEPGAFAFAAANRVSPLPLPRSLGRRLTGVRR